ncbi:MAG: hypothetical protein RIC14_11135 [Filomicrobium sp.]
MTSRAVLAPWSQSDRQVFGKHPVRMSHRLAETGLFDEATLAQVIEDIPESHYNLTTMGYDHENPDWKEGHLGGNRGQDVIDAIRRGRMWLSMRALEEVDQRYRDVLTSMMEEFESEVEDFHTFKRTLGVLISSPQVRVFYHADVPGQSLWQISGRKRLYVYPNTEPFLKPEDMEKVVLGMTEEEIPFEPWFDDYAKIYDLGPGDMVHWPLNGPHQVINEDCLNISVTTSHWTRAIRDQYAVNYANGVLRQNFGYTPRTTRPTGLSFYPKAALAVLWKKLNLQKHKKFVRELKFQIDPKDPTGISQLRTAMVK